MLVPVGEGSVAPKKLGPCCVCKETKSVRDQCLFDKDEEQCKVEIQNHNTCLASFGYSVSQQ